MSNFSWSPPSPFPSPADSYFVWRRMEPRDLMEVIHVRAEVHPSLPERPWLFTERAILFPDGCLVLTCLDSDSDRDSDPEPDPDEWAFPALGPELRPIYGYAISHPILPYNSSPAFGSFVGSEFANPVASDRGDEGEEENKSPRPLQLYIHDVAILPQVRGSGLGDICVRQLLDVAREHGYKTTVLVSVNGTSGFWSQYGFEPVEDLDEALKEKVEGYGDDAVWMVRKED